MLHAEGVTADALVKFRQYLVEHRNEESVERYKFNLAADEDVQKLVSGEWAMHWSAHYTFAADDPLKAKMPEGDPARTRVMTTLMPVITGAKTSVAVISPYFVPGKNGTSSLVKLVSDGRTVGVLTNSLVANDVAAVHGGYMRSRKPLLKGGVQIWELKPIAGSKSQSSLFGSSGASLHTKAFIVDNNTVFVGSYNLDPRSTWLNCEQGVLVEDEALATQLRTIYAQQVDGQHAWKVSLASGELSWTDGTETFNGEPNAGAWRKFQAWFARTFHLDAQL